MELMIGMAAKAATTAALNAGLTAAGGMTAGTALAGTAVGNMTTGLAANMLAEAGLASTVANAGVLGGGAASAIKTISTAQNALSAAKTAGTILSAGGQAVSAISEKKAADFEAGQMQNMAVTERALAGRKANEFRRQTRLKQSALQARAAATGGATDPTIVDLAGQIEEEGEYNALTAVWEGQERANDLVARAGMRKKQGSLARMTGLMGAGGTILQGGSSLYKRYAG